MGDTYNFFFGGHERHRLHPAQYSLALEVELNNIKVIIMSLTILDTSSPVNANIVVVKKKTGVKIDPQPALSNVSITDNNPEIFTIAQPDPTGNAKAVVVTPVTDGTGTAAITAQADFGGGSVKNFSGPASVVINPELTLDLEPA